MSDTNKLSYEFGHFRLDCGKRVLTRAGETIALAPKATEILMMLVTNAGELVEKEDLLKAVWPDTFVEESNLSQNIFTLRRALGDERPGPTYIETVARRGYRFTAPVREISADENAADLLDSERAVPQPPVIAVLPFLNATGDPELEYLAQGITDNIINNLSRLPKLRVMSRSAISRYRTKPIGPQQAGKELGANAVLVGNINSRLKHIGIDVELVDVRTGWQLWGERFDSEGKDLLQIQLAITRQLLATLKLQLTGDEEKRVTARYTENANAYQAYLEGRDHWSRYTKKGVEKAITHFRRAIELDFNFALAYAGIVDCYLRLATNYLPVDDDVPRPKPTATFPLGSFQLDGDGRIRLRFEWDWKGAERELRRARDLKIDYPAAHQWHAAYRTAQQLYDESQIAKRNKNRSKVVSKTRESHEILTPFITSLELTPAEQVQVFCAIVREQIDSGNYEAGCMILRPWWSFGNWPKLDGLNQQSCADLLFTAGELAGFVASTVQQPRGQKHGEELLNGSVALFEQLGLRSRAAEARIELALCYQRQGLFDIARSTLLRVLENLSEESREVRTLALMRLGSLERQAGRLKDALPHLLEATEVAELCGPWITARCHLELASIYKDLGISEDPALYFDKAMLAYLKALYEFEAVGQHRYVAIVENNIGLLLLSLDSYEESEKYLIRSRKLFDSFSDTLHGAQVNETLGRLYVHTKQYTQAQEVINRAIETLELSDGEPFLAEALTTAGIVAAKQGRYTDAKNNFEGAYKVAERCGDTEGAGRALLIMFEEVGGRLDDQEAIHIADKLKKLLATSQQTTLLSRVEKSIAEICKSLEP